jgi:hypothetical protein
MEFHDYEPELIIVASLIKLCDFLFHHTPKLLLVLQRRLRRKAGRSTGRNARRPRVVDPAAMPGSAVDASTRQRRRRTPGERSS